MEYAIFVVAVLIVFILGLQYGKEQYALGIKDAADEAVSQTPASRWTVALIDARARKEKRG